MDCMGDLLRGIIYSIYTQYANYIRYLFKILRIFSFMGVIEYIAAINSHHHD